MDIVLPLKPEASLDALRRLAASSGWTLAADEQRTHYSPRFVRFVPDQPGMSICWREDHTLEVRSVLIEGDGLQPLAALLRGLLPCWNEVELQQLATSTDDLGRRLVALRTWTAARAGREPPEVLLEQIADLARHETPATRLAALHLAWSGGWPQLGPLVASRADEDPDEDIRQLWKRWLDQHRSAKT